MQIRWTCGWRPEARGSGGGTTPRTAWRPRGLPPLLPPRWATRCRAQRSPPRRYKHLPRPARRSPPRRYKHPQRRPPASRWRVGWPTCRPRGGASRPWSGCTTAACGSISTPGHDDDEGVSIPVAGMVGEAGAAGVCSDVACRIALGVGGVCSDVARRVALQPPRRDKKSPFYQLARLAIAFLVGAMPSVASARPSQRRIAIKRAALHSQPSRRIKGATPHSA